MDRELADRIRRLIIVARDISDKTLRDAHINRAAIHLDDYLQGVASQELTHTSDCAVHNEPALPAGPCNCVGVVAKPADVSGRSAFHDVALERAEQMTREGYKPNDDDLLADGDLARAAASYAFAGSYEDRRWRQTPPPFWPWKDDVWKSKSQRRDLVRAGALILAEIERLDRIDAAGITERRNLPGNYPVITGDGGSAS